jgi:hypothetical protein
MSMPENANEKVYRKYYPAWAAMGSHIEDLEKELASLKYTVSPLRDYVGPTGFSYEAFYFTELYWLSLIQDQLNKVKSLRESIAYYQMNNVAKARNRLLGDLEVAGMHDVYDWIS